MPVASELTKAKWTRCVRGCTTTWRLLSDKGIEITQAGDCTEVVDIAHAIQTGYDAANAL